MGSCDPHHKLMEKVAIKISDGRVLKLIESYLKAGVFEVYKGWEATEEGTPQGGVMSPLLANIYLDDLDGKIAEAEFPSCESGQESGVGVKNGAGACSSVPAMSMCSLH